jgi:hypothetical protein
MNLSGIKRQFKFLSMCREQFGTSWEETKIMYTYPQNTCIFQVEVAEKRAFFGQNCLKNVRFSGGSG